MKSRYFKRFVGEAKSISPHIRFRRIRNGFYRIYWNDSYIGEAFEQMPENGYDVTENDHRMDEQQHYEKYMNDGDAQRLIKNFVEGYHESLVRIRTRVHLFKHDKEFHDLAVSGYRTMRVR